MREKITKLFADEKLMHVRNKLEYIKPSNDLVVTLSDSSGGLTIHSSNIYNYDSIVIENNDDDYYSVTFFEHLEFKYLRRIISRVQDPEDLIEFIYACMHTLEHPLSSDLSLRSGYSRNTFNPAQPCICAGYGLYRVDLYLRNIVAVHNQTRATQYLNQTLTLFNQMNKRELISGKFSKEQLIYFACSKRFNW